MSLWTQKTVNLNSRRPTSNFLFPDPFNYGKVIIFSLLFAGFCAAQYFLEKMMYHYESYRKIILWKNNHKNRLWRILWKNNHKNISWKISLKNNHKNILWENDETRIGEQEITSRKS